MNSCALSIAAPLCFTGLSLAQLPLVNFEHPGWSTGAVLYPVAGSVISSRVTFDLEDNKTLLPLGQFTWSWTHDSAVVNKLSAAALGKVGPLQGWAKITEMPLNFRSKLNQAAANESTNITMTP